MTMSAWEALINRQEGYRNFTPALHLALADTPVAVVGLGGNGAVLDLLVRAGFTRFVIIDPDHVEDTNLNRLPFDRSAIGLPKTAAWERHLLGINPQCEVTPLRMAVSRHDGEALAKAFRHVRLVLLGTTDAEANLVTGRVAARLGIRMLIGPASSGSGVISTLTHDNGVTVESLARFGTEHLELEDIDYGALREQYARAMAFPGRTKALEAGVWDSMRHGLLPARSCGMFVRLANSLMAFEAVKNAAELAGLPLHGTRVVKAPLAQIFDPWSGAAYLLDIGTGKIGIPDWLTGDVQWKP